MNPPDSSGPTGQAPRDAEWGESAKPFYRVLVVDDEVPFTKLIKRVLEADGRFEVHCENDSRQAIQSCLSLQPDVVLLDWSMPLMDGEEVYRQIKSLPQLDLMPVVMISAYYSDSLFPGDGTEPTTPDGRLMLKKPATAQEIIFALRFEIQKALEKIELH